jgi:fatty-acyl-CoA synthase
MSLTPPAAEAYHYPLLIKQLLTGSNGTAAKQEIISNTGDTHLRLSYADFRQRIAQLAHTLRDSGISEGMRVGVMDWDTHRYLECFFAVPMMGAVLHTINVRLSPAQVLYTINHGEPDLIIVHQNFMPLIEEIQAGFERDIVIIPIGDGTGYEDWIADAPVSFDFPDFDENQAATMFYTTGTTGNPKGVSYSHRQLVLHTLGLVAGFGAFPGNAGFHRGDVYMPLTPLFHVHGWGFPYAATMLGLRQVYPSRYTPDSVLRLIATEGVTFSHCVPTILAMLLDHRDCQQTDLCQWKVIIGGAALARGLQERAAAMGISLHAAYGMSETCPFLTMGDLASNDSDAQAQTGFPGPLVDVRVVTPDRQDVPHDGETTGEVVVRAPWLTLGYLRNQQASDELWAGGYLHTGDVGYMREDGSLQITDRLKDVIKTGGEWISSLALENIASSCSGIEDVAAIGVPHAKWGERPVLVAQLEKDADPNRVRQSVIAEIQSRVDVGELSKWAIPDEVCFVDQLPKTSVGKLDKKVIRKNLLARSEGTV